MTDTYRSTPTLAARGLALWILLALQATPAAVAEEPAVERLAEAVRFRTISYQQSDLIDYGEFDRFNAFLRRSFPRVFSELQVETVNRYSLLIRWPGSDTTLKPVLFTAHSDVVPIEPGTEGDWQHPPFDGVLAQGRVHGRGTLDDKVGVMGLLEAAERLLADGFSPRRGIVFAFGHDEEIGGNEGAARIAGRLRELGLHFEWMVDEGGMILVGSPMLPERPVAMVNVGEKGYLTLTLVASGEGGHSSNPPQTSTIGRLSRALARIEANPFPPRLVGPVEAMFEAMAPHVGQPERLVFENLWLTAPLVANRMADQRLTQPFVRTTTALTMFNAGVKENVVPQRAEAVVNFRLLPGDTPDGVAARIEEIVDDPLVEVSYQPWDNMPPVSDHEGPGFAVIAEAVQAVHPDAVVVPSLLVATTDTRHYIDLADDQYRFHGMIIEAGQASSVHGTNEYIGVESYRKVIDIATEMIRRGTR
jgi:carboxypeptidase PM20D1